MEKAYAECAAAGTLRQMLNHILTTCLGYRVSVGKLHQRFLIKAACSSGRKRFSIVALVCHPKGTSHQSLRSAFLADLNVRLYGGGSLEWQIALRPAN
jgi:hypothetical protein